MNSQKIRYTCDICKHTFRSKQQLIIHIQQHSITNKKKEQLYKSFKCELCDKTYTSSRNVRRHMDMHHTEKKYYNCKFCPKFYNSNHSLTRHFKSVHCTGESVSNDEEDTNTDDNNYIKPEINTQSHLKCKCGIKFEDEILLRNHVKNDHSFETYYEYGMNYLKSRSKSFPGNTEASLYRCKICLIEFSTDNYLKDHMTKQHRMNIQKCNVCNKKFESSETKNRCKECDILHSCQFCDKLFSYRSSLEFHTKIFHTQTVPEDTEMTSNRNDDNELCSYKCLWCDKKYYSDRSLKHHVKLKHTTDEAVECSLCGKICSNKYYLQAHVKMCHNTDTLLQCAYCEKEFKSKRNIRRHIENTHLGKQRYKCLECQMLFKEKRNLRKHVRSKHRNSKVFPQCTFCKKLFESAKAYKIHLKLVHSYSVKEHPCDFCLKFFDVYDDLKNHIRTNHLSKDLIYKCDKCNTLFNTQEKFDKHNVIFCNSEEDNTLPRCILCMKDFKANKTLRRHIKKFHSTFDVDELANYGTTHRNFDINCEDCDKKFNDDSNYNLYLKLSENPDTPLFNCEVCNRSYNCLEFMIQRYRNNENCQGETIVSELCTAEMSDDGSSHSDERY